MTRSPRSRSRKRAISRSTLALIGLWVATAALVSIAHWTRPPASIRLEVTAETIAFTLAGRSSQLLLGATSAESFTIAGFRGLEPGVAAAEAPGATAILPADAGASLSIRPADIEAVSAAGQALVRVSRIENEPQTRITISRGARGAVRLDAQAEVTCYRCGDAGTPRWLARAADGTRPAASLRWNGRDDSGGTDLLLRTPGALALSDDDLHVEGALETREAVGDQFVSTVREASLRFLGSGREVKFGRGARLDVGGIEPGTGLLKRLEAGPQGVAATLEARVASLSIEEAGRTTTLLPSYLEVGFHNQRWLYLAQGLILVGGTLTKIMRALSGSKET